MATTDTLTTIFTTPSDRELVGVRVFDAPKSVLWEMHTLPDHLQQWMLGPKAQPMSMPVCEIDLRPGGKWRYVWQMSNGVTMGPGGEFKEVIPEDKLVQTENWGGNYIHESINTTLFTEENGKTTVTTTVLYASEDDRQAAIGTGMLIGWSDSNDRLEDYLRRNT
jgi:uncharacterized protein YndB with AHSA1/START domain